MRKLTAIIIITLFLSAAPIFAQYSGGSGTESDPWQIAGPNDLLYLADHPNDYNSHFILTADINLAGYSYTTAIISPDTSWSDGFQGKPFAGIFDGNGNTIFSLIIDDKGEDNHYLGLFGYIDSNASVNNLNLEDVNITGGYFLGSLCGYNHYGTISNCYTTGRITGQDYLGGLCGFNRGGTIINCVAKGSVSGDDWVGGLCGRNPDGTIINCAATCSVTGGDYSGCIGGLCGDNSSVNGKIINSYATSSVNVGICTDNVGGLSGGNYGTIIDCYATGDINGGDGADHLGGLCGSNGGAISECYATGNVNGDRSLGGLCGYNTEGIITRCYATGTVNGIGYRIGGLCGRNYYGSVTNCYSIGEVSGNTEIGGLCGWNYSGSITDCFSTGAVSGSSYIGGLCGLVEVGGTITSCFWDTQTSGRQNGVGNMEPDPCGAMGRTTAQMQTQSTFTDYGWDFVCETANGTEDIWHMPYQINGYPMLYWQRDIPGDITASYGVNWADFAMMANAWRSTPEDDNWNSLCDLYPDDVINYLDLQILVENWLICRWSIAGDIAGSYGVNLADFAVIANAWRSTPGDDNWNSLCNLYPDKVIDWLDLQILVENWLNGL